MCWEIQWFYSKTLSAENMATTTASSSQVAKGKFEVQLISNEVKQLDFWEIPDVVYEDDPTGALFMNPPKVVMIQGV